MFPNAISFPPSEMRYSSTVQIPLSRKWPFPIRRYLYVRYYSVDIQSQCGKKVRQLRLHLALCYTIIILEVEETLHDNAVKYTRIFCD
jgi:hypothetical protein